MTDDKSTIESMDIHLVVAEMVGRDIDVAELIGELHRPETLDEVIAVIEEEGMARCADCDCWYIPVDGPCAKCHPGGITYESREAWYIGRAREPRILLRTPQLGMRTDIDPGPHRAEPGISIFYPGGKDDRE